MRFILKRRLDSASKYKLRRINGKDQRNFSIRLMLTINQNNFPNLLGTKRLEFLGIKEAFLRNIFFSNTYERYLYSLILW